MNFWHVPKPGRGTFWRNVSLRPAKHFVADHEFLHCSGAQQRRKIVRVEVPFRMRAVVGGSLMKAHRIWKECLKQIIVTRGDSAKNIRKKLGLLRRELVHRREMPLADHQSFKRPDGPKRS